ncbi:hypothetical protein [Bdellovibrio bacteriovorus]|uniref:hypothetical protein n=1 Tax=Bdellovibrio bacteriovorus TaxID=959 RepID=UPI0035A59B50
MQSSDNRGVEWGTVSLHVWNDKKRFFLIVFFFLIVGGAVASFQGVEWKKEVKLVRPGVADLGWVLPALKIIHGRDNRSIGELSGIVFDQFIEFSQSEIGKAKIRDLLNKSFPESKANGDLRVVKGKDIVIVESRGSTAEMTNAQVEVLLVQVSQDFIQSVINTALTSLEIERSDLERLAAADVEQAVRSLENALVAARSAGLRGFVAANSCGDCKGSANKDLMLFLLGEKLIEAKIATLRKLPPVKGVRFYEISQDIKFYKEQQAQGIIGKPFHIKDIADPYCIHWRTRIFTVLFSVIMGGFVAFFCLFGIHFLKELKRNGLSE